MIFYQWNPNWGLSEHDNKIDRFELSIQKIDIHLL